MPSKVDKTKKMNIMDVDDIFSEGNSPSANAESQDSALTSEDNTSAKRQTTQIKGSKSWEKDDYNENSWTPANLLKATLKDQSFYIRWVRDGSHSKVDRALDDGYDFVYQKELANFNKSTLRDGLGPDSTVTKRELVLMKTPKTRMAARRKWLDSQNVDAKSLKDQFRGAARGAKAGILEEEEAKGLSSVSVEQIQTDIKEFNK